MIFSGFIIIIFYIYIIIIPKLLSISSQKCSLKDSINSITFQTRTCHTGTCQRRTCPSSKCHTTTSLVLIRPVKSTICHTTTSPVTMEPHANLTRYTRISLETNVSKIRTSLERTLSH